jgi:Uma2 family endonuclease
VRGSFVQWVSKPCQVYNGCLVDYVLVSSEEIAIDIYHKKETGEWVILSYRSGDLVELKSIDLRMPIEQVYEEIVFDALPE